MATPYDEGDVEDDGTEDCDDGGDDDGDVNNGDDQAFYDTIEESADKLWLHTNELAGKSLKKVPISVYI